MDFSLAAGFFSEANHIEAALWLAIGAGFIAHAVLKAAFRKECLRAAITFIAFGFSDIVEARTGAWWRPWWLLVWKGACVLVFLLLLIGYIRWRRATAR